MNTENKKNESSKNQITEKSDSDIAAAKSATELSSEVYGHNMDFENKKNGDPKQQAAVKPGSDGSAARSAMMKRGAEQAGEAVSTAYDKTAHVVSETYDKTAHAVSGAYDKTTHAVSETYDKTAHAVSENPGKTMLIALGIGVGLWIILDKSSRRSRTGRFARPVVNAISDIALEFFH